MNLDAVIIVLREVLEASMLGSLLLALAQRRQLGIGWCMTAVVMGTLCAWAYANALGPISEMWDYRGQELVNAAMQLGICLLFIGLTVTLYRADTPARAITTLMAMIIVLALTRELSEILLYLRGFAFQQQVWSAWGGGFVGFITGISVGVILYFFTLWAVDWTHAQFTILMVLTIIVAGLSLQAVSLLLQVDLLPSRPPLWDSSSIISEQSLPGQLLYALIGYEATPTLWHVIAYAIVMVVIVSIISARNPQHDIQ